MPTYTVKYSNFNLTKQKKNKIAKGITLVHEKVTGAKSFFAQVIFVENKKNYHFMGGKSVKKKQLFLNGQIRAGRSEEIKDKLIKKLRDTLIQNSGLSRDKIWVYIVDLPPAQMIEYGEILPQSGKEIDWFNNLPKKLKKKLIELDN
tara:strand:+ start:335 stop:775 length:441 start_codon:yes stop_codon:yes gene_type:complete